VYCIPRRPRRTCACLLHRGCHMHKQRHAHACNWDTQRLVSSQPPDIRHIMMPYRGSRRAAEMANTLPRLPTNRGKTCDVQEAETRVNLRGRRGHHEGERCATSLRRQRSPPCCHGDTAPVQHTSRKCAAEHCSSRQAGAAPTLQHPTRRILHLQLGLLVSVRTAPS
jgi:hypothetical protein